MTMRMGAMAVVVATLFAFGAGGCASTKQTAERDSLLNQNKELQDQLQAEKAAHAAAEARASSTAGQLSAAPAESTTPPAMNNDGGALDLSGPSGVTPRTSSRGGSSGRTAVAPALGEGIGSSINGMGEVTLEIQGDVLFDSGKASIKPSAKKTLDSVAAAIKKSYAGQMLRIEGHTDSSPVKSTGWDDNWDLGAARARSVMLYLASKGVSQKDMYIASFAANEPKSTKNQALNRRVDIVVVKAAR